MSGYAWDNIKSINPRRALRFAPRPRDLAHTVIKQAQAQGRAT